MLVEMKNNKIPKIKEIVFRIKLKAWEVHLILEKKQIDNKYNSLQI